MTPHRSFICAFAALACVSSPLLGQSILKNPLLSDGPGLFAPTHVAVGADQSIYVADAATQTIQGFSPNGFLQTVIPAPPSDGTWADRLVGLEVDDDGLIYAASRSGAIERFATDGMALGSIQLQSAASLSAIATGPGNRLFAILDGVEVHEVFGNGITSRIANLPRVGNSTIDLDVTDDGQLVALAAGYVSVLDAGGDLHSNFYAGYHHSHTDPGGGVVGDGSPVAVAAAGDRVYVADSLSGSIHEFSTNGVPQRTAFAVPHLGIDSGTGGTPLAISADGTLYGAATNSRILDRIGQERFESDYVGVTRFGDRPPAWPRVLEFAEKIGVVGDDPLPESDAPALIVPGERGQLVQLDFRILGRSGGYDHSFGVYPVDAVSSDPFTDRQHHRLEAIKSNLLLINENEHAAEIAVVQGGGQAPIAESLLIEAGTRIGFFEAPFLTVKNALEFQGTPFPFGPNLGPDVMLSDARSNEGRLDQFAIFLGGEKTIIMVEDLAQNNYSDLNMTDFVVQIDARLIPVPEPATLPLALTVLLGVRRRFRSGTRLRSRR